MDKRYEAGNWHFNKKEEAQSAEQNHRTQASMSVVFLVINCKFRKKHFLKKLIFFKNAYLTWSWNLHAGPQDIFWIHQLWTGGGVVVQVIFFLKTLKKFPVPSRSIKSNGQQAEVKLDRRLLAKQFCEWNRQRVFHWSKFPNYRKLRESAQFFQILLIVFYQKIKDFFVLKQFR